jgi:iron complex transport system ATP-binding protein
MSPLRCEKLGVVIGDTRVCQDLDLDLRDGQCWAILGRNGSGKTTLIHTLAGLRPAQQGTILLQQQTLEKYTQRQIARHIGVLFQSETDHFPSTVLEYTLMGRHPHLGWLQWESQDDIAIAEQALQQVDLLGLKQRDINTLSGGERRRMHIACLLTQAPGIAFLDEPGNHLDLQHQIETLSLIRDQYRERLLVMAAHDINLAARYCSHALLLFGEGETTHGRFNDVVTSANLQRLYGITVNSINADGHTLYYPA